MVWATAAAVTVMLCLVSTLVIVVVVNGLGTFWPKRVAEMTLADGRKVLGEIVREQSNPDTGDYSVQIKTGNRDLDPQRQDFRWVRRDAISETVYPTDVCMIERQENGNFYGQIKGMDADGVTVPDNLPLDDRLTAALAAVRDRFDQEVAPIATSLSRLSAELESIRRATAKIRYRNSQLLARGTPADAPQVVDLDSQMKELASRNDAIKRESDQMVAQQQKLVAELRRNVVVMQCPQRAEARIVLLDVVRVCQPNDMGIFAKLRYYGARIVELLFSEPRESNTEGGLFPAIFGTIMMVFLMAVACFPLGVLAGIYLGEYAKDGLLVRIIRVAVNNLAGIPSIVYGIFGLGFFVYGVGGLIDNWFFPELVAAKTPTFGTGGILWASLTLGLLTVPVVIVATEESLRVIPRGLRESSLALGATKFQTLYRVLLPGASPGIMTGFILAMARAAGEVAPLMITGVVKLAPRLPVDGTAPFVHLDRKFMHLGFHIYDIGFQSPNVEAAKPMIYVTTLLLLLIILAMTSSAIYLRNRMRKRYQMSAL